MGLQLEKKTCLRQGKTLQSEILMITKELDGETVLVKVQQQKLQGGGYLLHDEPTEYIWNKELCSAVICRLFYAAVQNTNKGFKTAFVIKISLEFSRRRIKYC